MASVVLKPDQQAFPVGTSVSAYPRSAWPVVPSQPEIAPSGSATSTAAVQADGSLTFTGLADGVTYVAYAVVTLVKRYVNFRTTAVPGVSSSFYALASDAAYQANLPFNVKDLRFGAKGDGVTDDTTAIQAAIDAAHAARGGDVYMPPGLYMISASLKLYDSVSLIGAGANWKDTTKGTAIKSTGVGVLVGLPMIDVNNTLMAQVRKLALVGPTTDATANTTQGISDFTDNTKQCGLGRFEDLAFRYLGRSCIALYGNVNWIGNFRADDCAWHKIHLKNSGNLGTGSDNHIEGVDTGYCSGNGVGAGSVGDGLFIEGGSNNECMGGRYYNQRYGIHVLNGSGNRFTIPRCEKNDKEGIFLDSTTKNIFDATDQFNNNLTGGAGGASIRCSNAPRNTIKGRIKNDPFAALPGVQQVTCTGDGSTTITAISDPTMLRADVRVTGAVGDAHVPASTYVVSVNTGAATAVLSNAVSAGTLIQIAPLPIDKGVVLEGASDQCRIEVDVEGVNVHAVQVNESSETEVDLICYDIGQSAYVVGGAAGTKDWNRLRTLNALDCGQRATATYDVVQVNAGTNNWIGRAEYVGLKTKKARDFIRISAGTGTFIETLQAAASQVTGSTLTDSGTGTQVRHFRGYTNSAPVVAVPATTVATPTGNANRWYYITAAAGGSCSIAVQSGPTITIPASGGPVPVFVPAGQTLTPTYAGGNAPTWVVHQVGT